MEVEVQDSGGAIAATDSSTIKLAVKSGPGALTGTTSVQAANGIADFTDLFFSKAGTYTLIASDGALSKGTSNPIVIGAAPHPAFLTFTQQPGNDAAGSSIDNPIDVTITDQYANQFFTPTAVSLSIATGPAGSHVLGTRTITTSSVSGVAEFTGISLDKAGTYTLKASAGTVSALSISFTLTAPAVPATLTFTQQPTDNAAGSAVSTVKVRVDDQYGNFIVTPAAVALRVATGPNGSHLLGTHTVNTVAGVATFTGLSTDKAGAFTLQAKAGNATATSNSFTLTAPAVASVLSITKQPVDNSAGSAVSEIDVDVLDQYGNLFTAPTNVNLSIATGPKGGHIAGNANIKSSAGVAVFTGLSLSAAGDYVLQAKSGKLLPMVTNFFTVTAPAAATSLGFTQQPVGNASGSTITSVVQVTVLDQYGNPFTQQMPVLLKIGAGPAGAHIAGKTTVNTSTASGAASFPGIALSQGGTFTLSASAGKLATTSDSFIMGGPPTAATLGFVQNPTDVVAGANMAPPVTVEVLDQYGALLTTDKSTITIGVATGPVTTSTFTAPVKAGLASFSGLHFNAAGAYTLKASDMALPLVDSGSFKVLAAAATHLTITQIPGTGSAHTDASTIAVAVEDKFNNVVLTDGSTVTLSYATAPAGSPPLSLTSAAVSGVATFGALSFPAAGSYALKATDSPLTPATSKSFKLT